MTEAPTELPAIDDDAEFELEHPDEIDEEEAERGLAMYRKVVDLDDSSTGLEEETA